MIKHPSHNVSLISGTVQRLTAIAIDSNWLLSFSRQFRQQTSSNDAVYRKPKSTSASVLEVLETSIYKTAKGPRLPWSPSPLPRQLTLRPASRRPRLHPALHSARHRPLHCSRISYRSQGQLETRGGFSEVVRCCLRVEHFVVDCLMVELVPEEQLLEERLPNSSAGDVGDYSVRTAGCSKRHYLW